MGAIHHSKNLQETSNSIYRSLKKGGVLVAQEPAMPDYTTHSEYEEKYNIIESRFGLTIRNGTVLVLGSFENVSINLPL